MPLPLSPPPPWLSAQHSPGSRSAFCGLIETSTSRLLLTTYAWLPPRGVTMRGAVLFMHGWGSHAAFDLLTTARGDDRVFGGRHETYEGSFAQHLAEKCGLAVLAYDCQSMGRSEGKFGLKAFFSSMDELVSDARDVLLHLLANLDVPEERETPLPVFLFGSSLGGAVAVRLAAQLCKAEGVIAHKHITIGVRRVPHPHRRGTGPTPNLDPVPPPVPEPSATPPTFEIRGLITVAAAITLERLKEQGCNRLLSRIAPVLSLCAPPWLELSTLPPNPKFAHKYQEHVEDPLTYKGPQRLRTALEVSRHSTLLAGDPSKAVLRSITLPFLGFHSRGDLICDPASLELLRDGLGTRDITVCWHNDGYHHLIQEPGNDRVRREIEDWVKERVAEEEGTIARRKELVL